MFGTTPEESDLMGGNNAVEVSIVDTGIAITTKNLMIQLMLKLKCL